MSTIMETWISFTLHEISAFLISEPICYFTALALLAVVVRMFYMIINGRR